MGNSYFGSAEYFQGPLSGKGSPGTRLGDSAKGHLNSFPFVVIGDRMELLVGGGNYPETCYVALMDAATDEIIYLETGYDSAPMTQRIWNLRPHQGRTCYVRIYDDENGEMGFINVDEIIEVVDPYSAVPGADPRQAMLQHKASPNPFNPSTRILFTLESELEVQVRIHDLRGHQVWTSSKILAAAGQNHVTWQGQGLDGKGLPAGTYLYSIEANGRVAASGKLSLVK